MPCVSLRGALFRELKANASAFPIKQVFHDRHHPSAWGHSLMAQMVVTLVEGAIDHQRSSAIIRDHQRGRADNTPCGKSLFKGVPHLVERRAVVDKVVQEPAEATTRQSPEQLRMISHDAQGATRVGGARAHVLMTFARVVRQKHHKERGHCGEEGGHQRSSEVIRGHQRPSEVIRGHQRPSEAIGRTQSPSHAIRRIQAHSGAFRPDLTCAQPKQQTEVEARCSHVLRTVIVPAADEQQQQGHHVRQHRARCLPEEACGKQSSSELITVT